MLDMKQDLPQLNTPCSEPTRLLEQHLLAHCEAIKNWFAQQWQLTLPPVYGSVDLRHAGFKLAPIDMNLFPAGFNNLNPQFFELSVTAARKIITQLVPNAKRILLIPENHTRNLLYWENIRTLLKLLEQADYEVRVGLLSTEIDLPLDIHLPSGATMHIEKIERQVNDLHVGAFAPDVILLNNDLSDGIPDLLQNLSKPVIPPAELGWSQRLKSEHFQYYAKVVDEFASLVKIDPWLVAPLFRHCGEIDFMQQDGMECLIANAEVLFTEIQKKYTEYHITHQPFLVVKADAGTYGMAVMTVRHIDELRKMNRKQRTKMSMTKGGQPVRRVIIQEGVYTFETIGPEQAVAEPVVYLWGETVVGGFYRVHKDRGIDESLNAPGMHFEPIAFSQSCHEPCQDTAKTGVNRFYLYGIVAQLSMLAAAREIKDQAKK
jgi:glutamate--cysteine ligase